MALTIVQPDTVTRTASAGADGNITREQIIRYAGYAVGATAVVGSVGVMTVVAPAQMALAAGVTAGCVYVADCLENDRDIVPSFPLTATTPVDVAPATSAGD